MADTQERITSGTRLKVGFKRHLRVQAVPGDAVYLRSERGATSLTGSSVEAVAPLLDGSRGLDDLLTDCPSGLSKAEVGAVVMRLVEAGLVAVRPAADEYDRHTDPAELAYWDAAGIDPVTALCAQRDSRVELLVTGAHQEHTSAALAAFSSAGLNVTPGHHDRLAEDRALSVVLCDDYLDDQLDDVDAAHRAAGRPWLLAKPGGAQVWIGPVFDPTVSDAGCWHCLAHRLRGHRQAETHLRAVVGDIRLPALSLPPLGAAALHLVALEAAKWVAGMRNQSQRAVWTLDSLDLRGRHHELRGRPQCPACGDDGIMARQAHRPIVLGPRAKVSRAGGGHRAMTAEQVMDRYGHLVSPVTGLLREITRNGRGPEFFNSFRAGPNLALTTRTHHKQMRSALRAENGGKGVTALHGRVSALCEAIERHSGYFHGDEARVVGSYEELIGAAVHPQDCLLFADEQYADRTNWNAAHAAFQYVPERFDETARTSWTPVWSMTAGQHRLLPTSMLYFGVPAEFGGSMLPADSNGNAAGSSVEDALLQGLLEVIERDAVALWWYNRLRAPAVDLDSFASHWVAELREVYAALGREVWVLDVSSDVGIPTMAALSRRTDKQCEDIMFGFGAHPDPSVALIRALTEMNQLMPAVTDTDRGGYGWDDPDAVRWWRTATVDALPYLRPDPTTAARTRAGYGYEPTDDLHTDVAMVQRRLEDLGHEVLVLDQTRPDVGLPVVKAIVPGMRSFWARFAPGRLFDVPVRLGRQSSPTAYTDLNPYPLFV